MTVLMWTCVSMLVCFGVLVRLFVVAQRRPLSDAEALWDAIDFCNGSDEALGT